MAGKTDILSELMNALLGQQQQGASAFPGGGMFAVPGSFMQTLGVPLAIMGNVEAARRKPVGAAYLSGIGQLLGDLGQQRQQFSTKSKDFQSALKIAQDRGILGKGLQGTINDLQQAAVTDPDFANSQLKDIIKFMEGQQKPKGGESKLDLDTTAQAYFKQPSFAQAPQALKSQIIQKFQEVNADPKAADEARRQAIFQQNQTQREATWMQNQQVLEGERSARMQESLNKSILLQNRLFAHEDALRNAKDDQTRNREMTAIGKDFTSQARALDREGRQIMSRAKDPKYPQAQLQADIDSLNGSIEDLKTRVSDHAGSLPPNFQMPKLKKIVIAPGGHPVLSEMPFIGGSFSAHGTVSEEGGGSGYVP